MRFETTLRNNFSSDHNYFQSLDKMSCHVIILLVVTIFISLILFSDKKNYKQWNTKSYHLM